MDNNEADSRRDTEDRHKQEGGAHSGGNGAGAGHTGNNQPIFNLPRIIVILIGIFCLVHLVRAYFLDAQANALVIAAFAFIPASYSDLANQLPLPSSGYWSPITHGFLHGDAIHLAMNSFWMAAFGSPLAKRIGALRFVVFTGVCMAAGALFHFVSYPGEFVPVIGASGAVSGYMGAAGRFAFNNMSRSRGLDANGPALGLVESFSNPQFLTFSLVWLVINFAAGSGIVPMGQAEAGIAWQAHVGGFLAGVLLFSPFDPRQAPRQS